MTTALLLAGGGSRSAISAGSLKYIKESGIVPDAVYGASGGALNGILYLQDEMEELEKLWLNISNDQVYKSKILSLWQVFTDQGSIYNSKPLEKLLRKLFNKEKIDSLKIPFYVGTSNITKLRPEIRDIRGMEYEEQIKWLLASASPPILFPTVPFKFGDELHDLVDAGLCTNYFINQAINDGHDTIICVSPTNFQSKPPKNLLDIVQATISTATFNYLDREIKAVEKINKIIDMANIELTNDIRKISLVLVRPKQPWDQGLIDFNYKVDRKSLIDFGYNIAKSALNAKKGNP
jgi:predicted acylesterase/phospholipase RssA